MHIFETMVQFAVFCLPGLYEGDSWSTFGALRSRLANLTSAIYSGTTVLSSLDRNEELLDI